MEHLSSCPAMGIQSVCQREMVALHRDRHVGSTIARACSQEPARESAPRCSGRIRRTTRKHAQHVCCEISETSCSSLRSRSQHTVKTPMHGWVRRLRPRHTFHGQIPSVDLRCSCKVAALVPDATRKCRTRPTIYWSLSDLKARASLVGGKL